MGRPSKWSPEFREEAVRMYRESDESIAAVARRLGLGPETFRGWVREDEVERGLRDGKTREGDLSLGVTRARGTPDIHPKDAPIAREAQLERGFRLVEAAGLGPPETK